MMQLTPQMRIMVAVEPVDFRQGIDGLARLCRTALCSDPFSGGAFVFRNRRGTSVKILVYDGQGFWLLQKRLSEGRFRYWPKAKAESKGKRALLPHELHVVLSGGNPEATRCAPQWRPVALAE